MCSFNAINSKHSFSHGVSRSPAVPSVYCNVVSLILNINLELTRVLSATKWVSCGKLETREALDNVLHKDKSRSYNVR